LTPNNKIAVAFVSRTPKVIFSNKSLGISIEKKGPNVVVVGFPRPKAAPGGATNGGEDSMPATVTTPMYPQLPVPVTTLVEVGDTLRVINDAAVKGKPFQEVLDSIRHSPRPLTLTFFRAPPRARSRDAVPIYDDASQFQDDFAWAVGAIAKTAGAMAKTAMSKAETLVEPNSNGPKSAEEAGKRGGGQGGGLKAAADPPRPQYKLIPFESILSQPRCLSAFMAFLMIDGSHHDLVLWIRLREFIKATTSTFQVLGDSEPVETNVQADYLGDVQQLFRLHFDSNSPMITRCVSKSNIEELANSCSMLRSMALDSDFDRREDADAALALKLNRQEQVGALLVLLKKIQEEILAHLQHRNGPYFKFYKSKFYRYVALLPADEAETGSAVQIQPSTATAGTKDAEGDSIPAAAMHSKKKSVSDENTLFDFFNLNTLRRGLSVHRAPKQEPVWLLGSGRKCGIGAIPFGSHQQDTVLSCSETPHLSPPTALEDGKGPVVESTVPVYAIVELSAVQTEQKWSSQITKVVCPPDAELGVEGEGAWNPPKQMPDFFIPNGAESAVSAASPPPPVTSAFVLNQSDGNLHVVQHTVYISSLHFTSQVKSAAAAAATTDVYEDKHDEKNASATAITTDITHASTSSADRSVTASSPSAMTLYLPRGLGIVCQAPFFRRMRTRLRLHFQKFENVDGMASSVENMQPKDLAALLQPFSFFDSGHPAPVVSAVHTTSPSVPLVDLPHVDISLELLFRSLDTPTIVKLFSLCLLEAKVLLVSSKYTVLTAVAETMKALLFPLTWAHVYVPILPRIMLDSLQCPAPFLIGIHSSYAFKRDFPYVLDLVVVDLDQGTIVDQFQGDDGLTTERPSLPRQMSQKLEEDLARAFRTVRCKDADDLSHDSSERQASYRFPEHEVQQCFLTFMRGLLQSCALSSTALCNADDRKVLVFDENVHMLLFGTENSLVSTRNTKTIVEEGVADFLRAFFSTQAFSIFLSTKFL
jgi:hypothetical protein